MDIDWPKEREQAITGTLDVTFIMRVIKPTPPRVEDPRPPRYDPRPLLMATDIPHKRSDEPRRDPRYDERLPLYRQLRPAQGRNAMHSTLRL
jgi:hypothetical protein